MRRPAFWVGCGLVAGMLLIPMPFRVSCHCEVQPVTRRYVPVPYEGRLDTALVEPGDLVGKGQTLARMDGREVDLELAHV